MGFFDFLGGGKDATTKLVARVTNKYTQSDVRIGGIEALAKMGTEEALAGICRRFSFKVDKTIDDEQEKSYAVQILVAKGPAAVPAMRRAMKDAESLSWPLRVLDKIAAAAGDGELGKKAHADMLEAIDEMLVKENPGYTRDPGRKLELISFISELAHLAKPEASRRIVPYLADFDQNVRAHALDALTLVPDEPSARLPVIAAMVRPEEEVRRVKTLAADFLVKEGWAVTESLDAVKALLATDLDSFKLAGNKLVRK